MTLIVPLLLHFVNAFPSPVDDTLMFGQSQSEQTHAFVAQNSDVVTGGFGESARRLLPLEPQTWEGGRMAFDMKVDPDRQNYFTVKLWGSDINPSRLVLFCEGKQIGYHHIGDIDLLDFGTDSDSGAFSGRFYYDTTPLPLAMTKAHAKLHFEIRCIGELFVYGVSFAQYQKPFKAPTRGIYSVYTHTDGYFVPPSGEKQGAVPLDPPIRITPGPELLDTLKQRLNRSIEGVLNKKQPLNQMEAFYLARAYRIAWTNAYHRPQVLDRILEAGDNLFRRYRQNPRLAYEEPSTWNPDWFGFGPLGQIVEMIVPYCGPRFDERIPDETGKLISRRAAYSEMLRASRDIHRKFRRWYTNQSMIVDLYMYTANRGVRAIDSANALPEKVTLPYLYQSLGMQPWLGSDGPDGKPTKMLGDHYFEVTKKGLTRELGFAGYYGEVLDWITMIYDATRGPDGTEGDPKIKAQIIKIARARSSFRYPALDKDGNRAMRVETIIGWRDAHYPGDVLYGGRFAWDGSALFMAATTLDPYSIGYAQQMLDDNQFFSMLEHQMRLHGLRVDTGMLDIPDQYAKIVRQPRSRERLPMSLGDFVWSDEEDGALAVKNGDDILYVSLYWRARAGINFLGRVHLVRPTIDRIAVVQEDVQYEPSGLYYTRPDEIDSLAQGSPKRDYGDIHSAHAGESLPIPVIPPGTGYKPGDESVYAGRGSFYTLRYGPYLVAMNMSAGKTYTVKLPKASKPIRELVSRKLVKGGETRTVKPMSTAVFFLGE